jgi:hypothetical protein
VVLRTTRKERNMIGSMLLTELERLQAKRRDALEAYNRTGNRAYMLEAQDTSRTITDALRESESIDDLTDAIDELMGAEQ